MSGEEELGAVMAVVSAIDDLTVQVARIAVALEAIVHRQEARR